MDLDNELTQLLKLALKQYIVPPISIDPKAIAHRFEGGKMLPILPNFTLELDDLLGIDSQKQKLIQNTEQFLYRLPANHCLMTGARGVGKSSLVKALLKCYHSDGLCMIELHHSDLSYLPQIAQAIANHKHTKNRYIVFCDDLAFDNQNENYRSLKSLLDGSLTCHNNILVYATSNRRHLLPQYMKDNTHAYQNTQINAHEPIDDSVSLSDRFGLWLSFYALNQEQYLCIVAHLLQKVDIPMDDHHRQQALQWASLRGNRSGRLAYQYAQSAIGQAKLQSPPKSTHPSTIGQP